MSHSINITPARPASRADAVHPLDPLGADEVATAVRILRDAGRVTPTTHFVSVALREPAKDLVHDWDGRPPRREALAVLWPDPLGRARPPDRGH